MERRILVVDDELSTRELLYDALTKVGYNVSSTHNGKEAIELARTQKPDLILLDFKMPDMDGVQTLKKIRDLDAKTRIVMLTGMGTEELERQARLSGASGFLRKNLGIDVIVKAIDEILQTKKEYGKQKIMVVDDDPGIRLLIKDFLIKRGYDVVTASSGEEALQRFKKDRPILTLLDIKLPGMDGIVTLKRLREIDDKVGVIMITGVKDQEAFEEAKKLGAFEYIVKPFDLNYLETSVMVKISLVSALL